MEEETDKYKNAKFYSQKTIAITTFLGGPLAAGYLIRENYLSLDEPKNGRNALLIGIVSTILLFVIIFSIPESIMAHVPNQIIPIIYTAIIFAVVEKIHGKILNQHKEKGHEFYSGWKAAGVGFVSLLILLSGLLGYAYLSTDNEVYDKYEKELAVFSVNEAETLSFYDELGNKPSHVLLSRIDDFIIPKWQENIDIVNKTNAYENLPEELKAQNKLLLEYSNLRIKAFGILRKAIQEGSDKHVELEEVNLQIEQVLKQLD